MRRYLRTLIGDIASRGMDRIELEALQFQGYAHGYHHERDGFELTPAARLLLGLCFCPSCLRRAKSHGVDLTSLQSYSQKALEAHFEDPVNGARALAGIESIQSDLNEPFFEWRKTEIARLLEEIVSATGSTKV